MNEPKKIYNCPICKNFSTPSKKYLKYHIETVHEDKIQEKFECKICKMKFVARSGLNYHVAGVHEKNKPFKCEICGYRGLRASQLKYHIEAVHEGKANFKCTQCESSFKSKSNLNSHVSRMHEKLRQDEYFLIK